MPTTPRDWDLLQGRLRLNFELRGWRVSQTVDRDMGGGGIVPFADALIPSIIDEATALSRRYSRDCPANDGEDLAGEFFILAVGGKLDRYEPGRSLFRAYSRIVLRRMIVKNYRKLSNNQSYLSDCARAAIEDSSPDPGDIIEARELKRFVWDSACEAFSQVESQNKKISASEIEACRDVVLGYATQRFASDQRSVGRDRVKYIVEKYQAVVIDILGRRRDLLAHFESKKFKSSHVIVFIQNVLELPGPTT